MRRWMRILSIGLLVVLLSSLTAFAQQPIELQFWTPFTGPDGAYMEGMVNQFNAEHEGKIKVELFVIAGGADYITKLALSIRTGAPPAVVILSPTDYIRFLDNLTSWTSDELLDRYGLDPSDFSPNIMASVTKNGRIYAIPLGTYCLGLATTSTTSRLRDSSASSAEQGRIPRVCQEAYDRQERRRNDRPVGLVFLWRMAVQGSVAVVYAALPERRFSSERRREEGGVQLSGRSRSPAVLC